MTGGNFWNDLFPRPDEGIHFENITIDVANKGCFAYFDTLACVRNGTLTVLGLSTFILCIYRIIRLHLLRHLQIHQYLIFYVCSLECIFLTVTWLIDRRYPQLEFCATLFQLCQFIFLCHYQWALATRILHHEKLVKWIVIPILGFCFIFCTLIAVLGSISPKSTWIECLEPHWLLLSIVEFFIIQLFMVAGIYVTRKINAISSLESFKRQQKIDLWSVSFAYEASAIVSVGSDISIRVLGNETTGCSGIYDHEQLLYTPIFAAYMVIKYLLPIWVLVIFYRPTRGYISSDEERLLGWSGDGSTRSTFSPVPRKQLIYNQLSSSHGEQEIGSPSYSVVPVLRRSQTSPALLSSARQHRNFLPPISEECNNRLPCSIQGYYINDQSLENSNHCNHSSELSGESDEVLIRI